MTLIAKLSSWIQPGSIILKGPAEVVVWICGDHPKHIEDHQNQQNRALPEKSTKHAASFASKYFYFSKILRSDVQGTTVTCFLTDLGVGWFSLQGVATCWVGEHWRARGVLWADITSAHVAKWQGTTLPTASTIEHQNIHSIQSCCSNIWSKTNKQQVLYSLWGRGVQLFNWKLSVEIVWPQDF